MHDGDQRTGSPGRPVRPAQPNQPNQPNQLSRARRAGAAAFVGTTIEWYDFFIFGNAASLVFPKLFFPATSPTASTLASFAVFWVGFLARPVGGILFGHLGDRIGRRRSLILTLLLMGGATTGIGLLPTYETAGILAPVLLCVLRVVQGLAVGGEWGGAVLLAAEHAPDGRRVMFAAAAQQGTPAGSLLAAVAFVPFAAQGGDAFLAWGWRWPFLFSAVLVLVALVVRVRVAESPEFLRLAGGRGVSRVPLAETVRGHSATVLLGVGACAIPVAGTYLAGAFALSWATTTLGLPADTVLLILVATAAGRFAVQPLAAMAGQRLGVRPVLLAAIGWYLVAIPVAIPLMSGGTATGLAVGIGLLEVGSASAWAVVAALLAEAFPVGVRHTAISLSQQLTSALLGGTAPMVAQYLLGVSGGSLWSVGGYQALLTVVSAVSVVLLVRRSAGQVDQRSAARPRAIPVSSVGGHR